MKFGISPCSKLPMSICEYNKAEQVLELWLLQDEDDQRLFVKNLSRFVGIESRNFILHADTLELEFSKHTVSFTYLYAYTSSTLWEKANIRLPVNAETGSLFLEERPNDTHKLLGSKPKYTYDENSGLLVIGLDDELKNEWFQIGGSAYVSLHRGNLSAVMMSLNNPVATIPNNP